MKQIDCPQCGARLDPGQADADSRIQCGQCGRRLKLARKRDLRQSPEAPPAPAPAPKSPLPPPATARGVPAPPAPSQATRLPRELLPPPSRTAISARTTESSFPVIGNDSRSEKTLAGDPAPLVTAELRATKSSEEVLREAARRKALQQRWSAAGLTLLVVACGIALYFLANPPKLMVSASNEAEVAATAASKEAGQAPPGPEAKTETTKAESAPSAPGADDTDSATEAAASEEAAAVAAAVPIAWGELRTVSRRDLEKMWAEVHPYVFRLTARKPTGDRNLSGVLLDSRGWVVTSLSAIEGAGSVLVWPAPADPLLEFAAENLRDEIRGIVAVDRSRDLVLLQINRRLVNVVTTLPPTDQLLVPGKTLIQAAAVGPERRAWLTEAKISRSEPSAFPAEIKQAIERRGLDLAPYWPAHGLPLSQGVGAALFTPAGELAGVNTGLSSGGTQYFAEAKWLQALVQAAREPAVPLSNLNRLGLSGEQAATASAGEENNPADSPVAGNTGDGDSPFLPGNEAEPIARRLAETARVCEAFGWLPDETSAAQIAVADALLAWREAWGLVRSRRLFPEDINKLSKQLAHWSGRIKAALLKLDRSRSAEFNRLAWESLPGETAEPRALFVRVVLQPGTSPRVGGEDTATLELIGLQQFVIATVQADIAPLLPESEWLVVVTLDPKEETLVSPEPGQQAMARRGTHLHEISEVKSIGLKLETPPPTEGDGGE